jgi:hypothetical protein
MRTVLADFQDSLKSVGNICDYIDGNVTAALSDPAVRDRHEFMQCAATVTLSGFFESFLRDLAKKCVDAVCALNRPFAVLPSKMRHAHYEMGGRILSRRAVDDRAGRPSRIVATTSDISFRLSSVATTPYDLIWEAFADTHSNPGSQAIAEYIKRFGIQAPWKKIEDKASRSATTLRIQLDSFLSLRNECAHTGKAKTVPTADDIRQFISLLELIGMAIVAVFEDFAATL